VNPSLLGIALLAVAIGAFVIRLVTHGRPDLQVAGLIATLLLAGVVVVLIVLVFRSALSPLD
jgi:hypothetical protein